jgi:hypothetical protein
MSSRKKSILQQVLQELTPQDLAAGFSYATDEAIWKNANVSTHLRENRQQNSPFAASVRPIFATELLCFRSSRLSSV